MSFLPKAIQRWTSFAMAGAVLSIPTALAADSLDFANGLYARKMYAPAIAEYEKFIQSNPSSPEIASAFFRCADSHYFTKDYTSAIRHFESFVQSFSTDNRVPMARFRLGTAHYHQKEFAEAIKLLSDLSQNAEDPNVRSGALYYLGKSYEGRKKTEKTFETYEQLIKNFPQTEYASYAGLAIGDAYLAKKDFVGALRGYKAASEKENPVELAIQARFKIAEIYFSQKNYTESKNYYERLFLDKTPPEIKEKALLGLFYCDYYAKDGISAQTRLDANKAAVEKSIFRPDILYLVAHLKFDQKKYEEALLILDTVLSDPRLSEDLKEKAVFKKSAVLAAQGQKDLSLKELDRIQSGKAVNPARAYFEKAELLSDLGRSQEALESYEAVFKEFKNDEYSRAALYKGALLHLKLKDLKSARDIFSDYLKRYPDSELAERAHLEIVQIDLDTKNFESASTGAIDFIKRYPKSVHSDIAHYKLGVSLTGQQKFNEAWEAFNQVAKDYPDSPLYPEALYGAGMNMESMSRWPEALANYEKILERFPEHALAKDLYARLGFIYIKTNDYKKIETLYEDVLLNKPTVKVGSEIVFWLVQYLLDNQKYESMKKILGIVPGRFSDEDHRHTVQFYLGEAAMGTKDYAQAIKNYTEAITLDPEGSFAAHAHLGAGIASFTLGDSVSAEKYFNETMRYDHEVKITMRARYEIANLRLRSKNYLEAAKGFMRVAILYEDSQYTPLSLFKAGEAFSRLGQSYEAQRAFEELKDRYPESKWAKKIHARKI